MGNPANIVVLGADAGDYRVAALNAAGYRCTTVPVESPLPEAIAKHKPTVVLISVAAPAAWESIEAVRSGGKGEHMPLAVIDVGVAPDILATCRAAGVDDIFEDGVNGRELVARMRALVRLGSMEAELVRRSATASEFGIRVNTDVTLAPDSDRDRLLVVGAEDDEIDTFGPLLRKSDIELVVEPDPYRARSRIERDENGSFDGALVYIRDDEMKERCDYFCRSVRNDRRLFDLPLFLIAEKGEVSDPGSAYDVGANVVAETPLDGDFLDTHLHLLLRGRDRRRALGRRIAATLGAKTADELADVYSANFVRAHFDKLRLDQASQVTVSSAILFFIPTIGEVAALYGLEEAAMLRGQLASWLSALVRVEDTVGRTGADEFITLLPGTALPDAELVRRRVVGILHQSEFRMSDKMPIGIAAYVQSGTTEIQGDDKLDDVIARARQKLA